MDYIGEQLIPGMFGNFFLALSFSATILATTAYYFSAKDSDDGSWRKIGRTAFRIHSLSVLGIFAVLFYMLLNHLFEYHYVWQHSNTEMPMRYILSCFWEGQEGSFMLWSFWNMVLGNILIKTAKDWEGSTMTVVSSVQVFLSSMLLGLVIFEYKLGSNPFILLREHPDMVNMPFTRIADYVDKIDGRGLNPILQNYWMIIHPPTLFLGFSSVMIPFAYAIAGFWKKRFNDWQKPALPWAFFGVMILGTGVLMGGAWAYEALSFGGFWAWDPVENASLVPWITLVASAHVILISKNTGKSVKTAFILTTVTFVLILYSTFLTRSGILGDTSVHAFTDLGMSGQLLIYLIFYCVLTLAIFATRWKYVSGDKKEDSINSREFWMFIGALVLLISAFQIIFSTSIPVINKVFGSNLAPPADPIMHYNSWQIPFAIIVGFLIGLGQFLKYKNSDISKFWKKIRVSLLIAAIFSATIAILTSNTNYHYVLLFFAATFAVVANANYFLRIMKGKISKGGSSIAHIGFGLILLGALVSTSMSKVISQNSSGIDVKVLGSDFSNHDNIMLFKNDTLQMGDYYVSYSNKRKEGVNIYFDIDYYSKSETGQLIKAFTLNPLVQLNKTMGNVAEPDTRHFLTQDIYTHITYADLSQIEAPATGKSGYMEPKEKMLAIGDTMFSSNAIIILHQLNTSLDKAEHELTDNDIIVGAQLHILKMNGDIITATPLYIIRDMMVESIADSIPDLGLKFLFTKIDPESGQIKISLFEKQDNKRDFVVMKAIIFPFINILWTGCIFLIFGSILAIRQRIKTS